MLHFKKYDDNFDQERFEKLEKKRRRGRKPRRYLDDLKSAMELLQPLDLFQFKGERFHNGFKDFSCELLFILDNTKYKEKIITTARKKDSKQLRKYKSKIEEAGRDLNDVRMYQTEVVEGENGPEEINELDDNTTTMGEENFNTSDDDSDVDRDDSKGTMVEETSCSDHDSDDDSDSESQQSGTDLGDVSDASDVFEGESDNEYAMDQSPEEKNSDMDI